MAGLAAAHLLKEAGFTVTIYEALPGRGMDSHSLLLDGGIVDAPLRVMNPSLWKNTLSLAAHVGVATFSVNTFMSCNWLQDQQLITWFKSQRTSWGNLPTAASLRFVNHETLTLIKGIFQLKSALKQFKNSPNQAMSLAEFASLHAFDPLFWYGTVLPVVNTICTCAPQHIAAWPAKPLLTFLEKLLDGEPLLRLHGGTPALVDALSRDIPIVSGSKVQQVHVEGNQVRVRNARGEQACYDYVVVATPTTQLDFLDQQAFASELAILKQFKFDQGELVIHRDERFMPRQRRDWTILNYSMDRQFNQQMFSIWINQIEPTLVGKPAVFQTWNPVFEPQPESVISTVKLTRAIVDRHTASWVQQLQQLQQQPERRVFFCGSWSCDGLPILESAVTSALWVAQQLGAPAAFVGKPPLMVNVAGLAR